MGRDTRHRTQRKTVIAAHENRQGVFHLHRSLPSFGQCLRPAKRFGEVMNDGVGTVWGLGQGCRGNIAPVADLMSQGFQRPGDTGRPIGGGPHQTSGAALASIGALLGLIIALTVFAGPVMRHAEAAAGQLHERRAYIVAVLGTEAVLDPLTAEPMNEGAAEIITPEADPTTGEPATDEEEG